jgi:hypothetical protein
LAQSLKRDVRFGSKAVVKTANLEFGFYPESGHPLYAQGAESGHRPPSELGPLWAIADGTMNKSPASVVNLPGLVAWFWSARRLE